MKSVKVDPKSLKTRDWALVRILQGATKAGIQTDRRKEQDRMGSREWRKQAHRIARSPGDD